MAAERTAVDGGYGDGGGVECWGGVLEEKDLQCIRRESFLEESYEGGGDGVCVDFLQMQTVFQIGFRVVFGGGFARRLCVAAASPSVRVDGRFWTGCEGAAESFPEVFVVGAVEEG